MQDRPRIGRRVDLRGRALLALVLLASVRGAPVLADDHHSVAILGGRIETLAGPVVENGVILIVDGRIEAIGPDVKAPEGAEVIDARGGAVFPGLVNPATALGLSGAAGGKPASNPQYRAADELYPFQDAYKLAARAGFTTLALWTRRPGISGEVALARTVADGPEEMLLSELGPVAVDFRPDTDTQDAIKGALDAAAKGGAPGPGDDLLTRAVQGETPLLITCSGAGDVVRILKLMGSYEKAKPVLVCSGDDVQRVADQLGAKHANVILPARIAWERYTRNRINVPRILAEAGARVACVPYGDSVAGYEAYRGQMAELVHAGLTRDEALKAMTILPATMLGLDYRLGSLEKGKDANLVILSGDLLDARAKVLRVLIEGKTVYNAEWGGLR